MKTTAQTARQARLTLEATKLRKDRREVLAHMSALQELGYPLDIQGHYGGKGCYIRLDPHYATFVYLAKQGYIKLGKTITVTSHGMKVGAICQSLNRSPHDDVDVTMRDM